MAINSEHTEHYRYKKQVELVRDCIAGDAEIKRKTTRYLPEFEFEKEDSSRYQTYVQKAVFDNITGRTLAGFSGSIFRKQPENDIPTELEYLLENANGEGLGLAELEQFSCEETMTAGTIGFLVEYPMIDLQIDAETEQILNPQAHLKPYVFESVINYKTSVINGKTVLSQVVLHEKRDVEITEFETDYEDIYRVLRLDENGYYNQQVYDDSHKPITEPIYPRKVGQELFDYIPFVFIGASNNLFKFDKPMLYDIAVLNIAHFVNSADYEENLFMHGQLTIGISTSLDNQAYKEANPDGLMWGARSATFLGENGNFVTASVPENNGLEKAMQRKEERMVAIGAKLIMQNADNETAEAARIRNSSETSNLTTIVNNNTAGFKKLLTYCTDFMGGNPDAIEIQLNKEFYPETMTAQEAAVMMQLVDRGTISEADMRSKLRKVNWLDSDRTDEDIEEDAENDINNSLLGNTNDNRNMA
jgi:hypothetical protein